MCTSAGNHAQVFYIQLQLLNIKGGFLLPTITPMQRLTKPECLGSHHIEIILSGDTHDDCAVSAKICIRKQNGFLFMLDDEKNY